MWRMRLRYHSIASSRFYQGLARVGLCPLRVNRLKDLDRNPFPGPVDIRLELRFAFLIDDLFADLRLSFLKRDVSGIGTFEDTHDFESTGAFVDFAQFVQIN